MKKKILGAIFAVTTMLALSAMTAFAEVDVTYNFDSADELSGATITGNPLTEGSTVEEVVIEDGQLIMNSTYGILLPDVIDTTSYEVSYTVTYNSVPTNTGATIFIGEVEPENWIAFGFGNTAYIGEWAKSGGEYSSVITDVAHEDGGTYNVKFVVQEGNLTIYVDDVEKASGAVPNIEGDKKVYIGVTGWDADTVDFKLDNLSIKTISDSSEEESQNVDDGSAENSTTASTGDNAATTTGDVATIVMIVAMVGAAAALVVLKKRVTE